MLVKVGPCVQGCEITLVKWYWILDLWFAGRCGSNFWKNNFETQFLIWYFGILMENCYQVNTTQHHGKRLSWSRWWLVAVRIVKSYHYIDLWHAQITHCHRETKYMFVKYFEAWIMTGKLLKYKRALCPGMFRHMLHTQTYECFDHARHLLTLYTNGICSGCWD